MAGIKVGQVDIQFGPEFDREKANQLVQSLQKAISAINTLAGVAAAPPTPGVPVHELASQQGLGADHTVAGLLAGQVLVAQSATQAHFAQLTFGELAQT